MRLSKQIALTLAVLLVSVIRLQPLVAQAEAPHAVLLPNSAVKQLQQLCSRNSPRVDGVWTPSASILGIMESRIDKIAGLNGAHGKIRNPRQAYRQYLGISVEGKRYIYINGMCEKPRGDWNKRLQDVCDGGSCFWGVLYNVESGSFSDIQTNGNA